MKNNVKIFEQVLLKDKNGKTVSKLGILVGGLYTDNPTETMNEAVKKYWGDAKANEFIDIKLNNPWTRVIISNINDLEFQDFDVFLNNKERNEKISIKNRERKKKLEIINKNEKGIINNQI